MLTAPALPFLRLLPRRVQAAGGAAACATAKMIIPVRCFTCGKVIGNKWQLYMNLIQGDYSDKCGTTPPWAYCRTLWLTLRTRSAWPRHAAAAGRRWTRSAWTATAAGGCC